MPRKPVLLLALLLVLGQGIAVVTAREAFWPFSPVAMYARPPKDMVDTRLVIAVETGQGEAILGAEGTPYRLASLLVDYVEGARDPAERARRLGVAARWVDERYRRSGAAVPTVSLYRYTWDLEAGGPPRRDLLDRRVP